MKAIQISDYGNSSRLQIQNIAQPQFKTNEILVKVFDAGVNPVDWKIREGYMRDLRPAKFPLTLGQDFAGEVLEVGSQTSRFKPGDRVFGFAQGAYAELAAVSEKSVAPLPDSVSFEEAASLPTPGLTAYQLITEHIRPQPGQVIVIQGAAGAVGTFAVQLAKWKGAKVIAVASQEDEAFLKSIGAERVIDYKTKRFENEISEPVDAVIDLVGGETLARSFQIVKKGGIVTTTVGPMDQEKTKAGGIQGVQFVMKPDANGLSELVRLVEAKIIRSRLSEVMPLEKAREAQDLNQKGQSHGKIILQIQKH